MTTSQVCQEDEFEAMCFNFQPLMDLCLALGNTVGLIALRMLFSNNLLGSREAVLVGYARRVRLLHPWSQVSTWQCGMLIFAWTLAMIVRTLSSAQLPDGSLHLPRDGSYYLRLAGFAFASGLFGVLTYSLLHVMVLLTMMVDAFCFRFVEEPHLEEGVQNWNILQAVLRRASGALEVGFLAMQTTTLMTALVGLTAVVVSTDNPRQPVMLLLAAAPLNTVSARLFFKASEVTEKCTRVPSLINSLSFGRDVDLRRHYLVQYITYSAAGFYVKEVRLTSAMTIKLAYASGIIAFGVLTKIASTGG